MMTDTDMPTFNATNQTNPATRRAATQQRRAKIVVPCGESPDKQKPYTRTPRQLTAFLISRCDMHNVVRPLRVGATHSSQAAWASGMKLRHAGCRVEPAARRRAQMHRLRHNVYLQFDL
jgi:hypothetical protein